jgi:hypothetical protein
MIDTLIPRIPRARDMTQVARLLRERGRRLSIASTPSVRADVWLGHSNDSLCLQFRVEEPTVRAVAGAPNEPVFQDSCVECFISFGVGYYNIELNCIGTPLVGFGIDRHRRHRLDPSVLRRISALGSLGSKAFAERPSKGPWELSVVVPTAVFAYHPGRDLAGTLARANFYKCGDELQTPHWESWAPVRTATPDFHRPEFFAPVRLAD